MIYVDQGLRLDLDLGYFVDDLILAMSDGSHLTINNNPATRYLLIMAGLVEVLPPNRLHRIQSKNLRDKLFCSITPELIASTYIPKS